MLRVCTVFYFACGSSSDLRSPPSCTYQLPVLPFPPVPKTASKQQAIYFANLAACNIKTLQFAYAVQNCSEAIRLDGSYTKAYMRRCEALERLDEIDNALADAKALLAAEPDNAWAQAKVVALQPRVDERTEKLKVCECTGVRNPPPCLVMRLSTARRLVLK